MKTTAVGDGGVFHPEKDEKQPRILHSSTPTTNNLSLGTPVVQDDSAKSAFGVIFRADPSTASAAADSAKDDKEDYLLSCPTNL
jgi:hypothetical protein